MKSVKPFRARPIDSRVLESVGDLGLPKVPKSAPTEPKEFNFYVDKRFREREAKGARTPPRSKRDAEDEQEMSKQFKARPFNPALTFSKVWRMFLTL